MKTIIAVLALALTIVSAGARSQHHAPEHDRPTFFERFTSAFDGFIGSLSIAPKEVFATYYGGEKVHDLCGSKTSTGERYDCAHDVTAAHRTLPLNSHIYACGPAGCARVRINDRGPFADNGAELDLSMEADKAICGRLTSCHLRFWTIP